jgi:hypothetical protein
MMNIQNQFGRGLRPLLRTPLFAAALALPLFGCEDILDVEDPDVARPESVQSESALPAVLAAMVGDFQVAYGGSPAPGFAGSTPEGQILISGLLGDEYIASGSFPTRVEVDQRMIEVDNATMQGAFRSLHRARVTAERSVAAHAQFSANSSGHAQSLSFAGYTYIFFGENYCAGVPFSQQAASGEFEFGAGLSTEQMFQQALQRFDAALTAANAARASARGAAVAAATAQQNLARIGRGRALLNLGRFQDAAAAVRDVPTGFEFEIQHSENSSRQNNGVHNLVNIAKRWSVADREGGNGLPYRSANDPRVPSVRTGVGFDQTTPHFSQLKYANRSADIPLATGVEARLIEAEIAARSGDAGVTTSLGILNALRASANLPAITGGSVDDVFRERAFWMWQTSHRLGDMRRLVRQYGRNKEQVFPTGQFFKGGTYGPDVNFPVPVDEENNPNFQTCTNRNA